MTRDPRIDPRPGDVVRIVDGGEWAVWTVFAVDDSGVRFTATELGVSLGPHTAQPEQWRRMTDSETVIYTAGAADAE